jgi:hypothetical protein
LSIAKTRPVAKDTKRARFRGKEIRMHDLKLRFKVRMNAEKVEDV